MRISQAAFDLIVMEEVSSKERYENQYRRPIWPGVASGPTIGIGYDLGHTDKNIIRSDWSGRVPQFMLDAMISCVGKTGQAGKQATAEVKNRIDIPWELAITVHKEQVIPRWEAMVDSFLPNTDKLSGDSFGALVSLTYNRGPSFDNQKPRYAEMRAIKQHMAMKHFAAIPAEFRAMKRLWPSVPGLQNRREREAQLFERGLGGGKPVGNNVADLQWALNKLGADPKLVEDGVNGPKTKKAVRNFQLKHGLLADGIAGERETWPLIRKMLG